MFLFNISVYSFEKPKIGNVKVFGLVLLPTNKNTVHRNVTWFRVGKWQRFFRCLKNNDNKKSKSCLVLLILPSIGNSLFVSCSYEFTICSRILIKELVNFKKFISFIWAPSIILMKPNGKTENDSILLNQERLPCFWLNHFLVVPTLKQTFHTPLGWVITLTEELNRMRRYKVTKGWKNKILMIIHWESVKHSGSQILHQKKYLYPHHQIMMVNPRT